MKLNANREGLSLVEVIVAMTLLAVVLTSLAGLSYQAARQAVTTSTTSYRQGVVMQEINRLTSMPFDNLPSAVGCTNVTTGDFPHSRCITVNVITTGVTKEATVQLIVAPSVPGVAADTVVLERTRPPTGNPLNTT